MKLFLILLSLTSLSIEVAAQRQPEFFKKSNTTIKDPLGLRDPFKSATVKIKAQVKKKSLLRNGVYTNLQTLNNVTLDKIAIVGVILGKERRAIAKIASDRGQAPDPDQPSFVIKEGMILGENNAEVRAILPGGIVLVEKIRNVYDQDEYIETVIPVLNY